MESGLLKEYLKQEGAILVGVGDITEALTHEIVHLNRGISIAVRSGLNRNSVALLRKLQKLTEQWLKYKGFRSLSIPPDSDRIRDTFISKLYRLFSHKTAATCSGLGWIGKNGLVITRQYGSKLSWATVLTNAPLIPDRPSVESQCGDCNLCVTYCPSHALSGSLWSREEPLKRLVDYERCSSLKKGRLMFDEKPNCGLCVTICPYSRNGHKTGQAAGDPVEEPLSEAANSAVPSRF